MTRKSDILNLNEWGTLVLQGSPELLVQLAVPGTTEGAFASRVILKAVGSGGSLVPTGRALCTGAGVLTHSAL